MVLFTSCDLSLFLSFTLHLLSPAAFPLPPRPSCASATSTDAVFEDQCSCQNISLITLSLLVFYSTFYPSSLFLFLFPLSCFLLLLTDCWSLALIVLTLSGSQMTMSASEPTAIRPLRGYRLKILAAFVDVTATNWFSSIFPMALETENWMFRLNSNWQLHKHTQNVLIAHHGLVPDEPHSLLHSTGSLWDQGEVIFTDCFLGSAVRAVSAAHHLEVPTVLRYEIISTPLKPQWLTCQMLDFSIEGFQTPWTQMIS